MHHAWASAASPAGGASARKKLLEYSANTPSGVSTGSEANAIFPALRARSCRSWALRCSLIRRASIHGNAARTGDMSSLTPFARSRPKPATIDNVTESHDRPPGNHGHPPSGFLKLLSRSIAAVISLLTRFCSKRFAIRTLASVSLVASRTHGVSARSVLTSVVFVSSGLSSAFVPRH